MNLKTPLYDRHVQLGGRMVTFGGWEMPIRYGSQIEEHNAVRQNAGLFDVSHMTVSDLSGPKVEAFLHYLLPNDIAKIPDAGGCLYSAMLNERGGVIDDLIVTRLPEGRFRIVSNAATREKDLEWMRAVAADFDVGVDERAELAMLALQGPETFAFFRQTALGRELEEGVLGLAPFKAFVDGDRMLSRTGYTGEDGLEAILPAGEALALWDALIDAGVSPIGLGARDTLRLEAGLNLYGSDMDDDIHPLESGLGWTVAWNPEGRDFIGRKAIEAIRAAGSSRKRIGLAMLGKGVMRDHQKVLLGEELVGEITSGGFSPTLKTSIAMARVEARIKPGDDLSIDLRGRMVPVRAVSPPFVKKGQPTFQL